MPSSRELPADPLHLLSQRLKRVSTAMPRSHIDGAEKPGSGRDFDQQVPTRLDQLKEVPEHSNVVLKMFKDVETGNRVKSPAAQMLQGLPQIDLTNLHADHGIEPFMEHAYMDWISIDGKNVLRGLGKYR